MQRDSSVAKKKKPATGINDMIFSQWLELWLFLDAFSKDLRMQIICKLCSSNAIAHVCYEVKIQ